ncbi:MAG: hypothetical protein IPN69_08210 [Acidobacteria bacterium]|nr:hypothetical protein [Acidobacteriota bacterium]
MSETYWYFAIGAIIACFALAIWYLKFRRPKEQRASQSVLQVFANVIETTALGITIASKTGVSAELKAAADRSLTRLFADCRRVG